jgi:hypothetical protein
MVASFYVGFSNCTCPFVYQIEICRGRPQPWRSRAFHPVKIQIVTFTAPFLTVHFSSRHSTMSLHSYIKDVRSEATITLTYPATPPDPHLFGPRSLPSSAQQPQSDTFATYPRILPSESFNGWTLDGFVVQLKWRRKLRCRQDDALR